MDPIQTLPEKNNPVAFESFLESIKNSLQIHGYVHIRSSTTLTAYEEVAAKLGRIINRDDIRIDSRFKAYSTSAEPIDFHNDFSGADYIGWYCINPEDMNGETKIADMAPIFEYLNTAEIQLLTQLTIPTPSMRQAIKQPLIQIIDNQFKLYYLPWVQLTFISEKQNAAFIKFKKLYDYITQHHAIPIKLNKGEFFFVNNSRIVHGRNQLPHNSQRWLKRIWIAKPEWDDLVQDDVKQIRMHPDRILKRAEIPCH